MAKIKQPTKAEIELEITNRVAEKAVRFEISIQARYQHKFERIHEFLNWIMDSSVVYDKDRLKMAESVIDSNRRHATLARQILRTMIK